MQKRQNTLSSLFEKKKTSIIMPLGIFLTEEKNSVNPTQWLQTMKISYFWSKCFLKNFMLVVMNCNTPGEYIRINIYSNLYSKHHCSI